MAGVRITQSKTTASRISILVDSFADEGFTNAQMSNGREIICRLDPEKFHVSVFHLDSSDGRIKARPNTKLIQLPRRRQTLRILQEFIFGSYQILFYLKASPASKFYMRCRRYWGDQRATVGTIESQSDLRNEPTISPQGVALWEQTILRCDFLFSNSRGVQRSLEAEYGLASEIVETGVDTKFFVPPKARRRNPRVRVLFVGSLRPFKQPQVLVDAAQRFPQADFVLAGEGLMADQLRSRVTQQKLTNVSLLGHLNVQALREQYQQADIFLFPSKWEGAPKVILEAAACGLPVIARKDYEPEAVIDGKSGFLAASAEELHSRLAELIANNEIRTSMGIAGRSHSETFDWDLITKKWESIFIRLASQQAMRRRS